MKKLLIYIFLISISLILGWFIGYLNIPEDLSHTTFLFGFTSAFCLLTFFYLSVRLYTKKSSESGFNSKIVTLVGLLIMPFLIYFIYRADQSSDYTIEASKKLQNELSSKMKEINNSNYKQQRQLFEVTFDRIREEAEKGNGKLSDAFINQIAAFSSSLKPYYSPDVNDSMLLIPERGKLLFGLCQMDLDSNTFQSLISKVDFAYSDLSEINLSNINLSNIRLKGSDLKNINLNNVVVKGADLRGVNFEGSHIIEANFSLSDLSKSNLKWSKIRESNLDQTKLNGVDFNNAAINNCSIRNCSLRWSKLNASMFKEVNFSASDFLFADFSRASLINCDLSDTRIRRNQLIDFSFSNTLFENAIVEKKWFEVLQQNQVIGREELMENYNIELDSSPDFHRDSFLLKRKIQ